VSTQVQIDNFQSWESAKLQIDGLTVIVGDSNLGKSALERAIKGLLRNELSNRQVRNGSEAMQVSATIDGHTIVATLGNKPSSSIVYNVDGEEFKKLNRAVPQPILDLRLGTIEIGDVTLDPIFADQFGSQFLLEEKPGPLNAILGAFSATERLEQGKRKANGEIAELNSQAKLLSKEVQAVETRRATLELLDLKFQDIGAVVDMVEPLVERDQAVLAALATLIDHRERLDAIHEVMGKLEVPTTSSVEHALKLGAALTTAATLRLRHNRITRVLSRLTVPDATEAATQLALAGAYRTAAAARLKHARTETLLKKLVVPGALLTETMDARVEILNLATLSRSRTRLSVIKRSMQAVEDIVSRWTDITVAYKSTKALTELLAARKEYGASRANQRIFKIDTLVSSFRTAIQAGSTLRMKATALAVVIEGRAKVQRTLSSWTLLDMEIAKVEADLESITQAERKALKDSLAGKVVCKKCGEVSEPINVA